MALRHLLLVVPGLVPGTPFREARRPPKRDGRDKPGHDGRGFVARDDSSLSRHPEEPPRSGGLEGSLSRNLSSPRKRGPIRRALSRDCGVWVPGLACFPRPEARYRAREVGGGRATRQPGQVRKEAALTSPVRVVVSLPPHFPRFVGRDASRLSACGWPPRPRLARMAR